MPDTKYCYPDTDILINKLDIRDLDKLHIFERKLTMLRLLELLDKPINGKFDFKHLQAIHAYIIQDVYDWAGKVPTSNRNCRRLVISVSKRLAMDASFSPS